MSNQPFSGEVTVHSRCMLPGCNGSLAGPSQKMMVERGQLLGTLNVGGHSGPFQIEVVSPRGSLRHQFEGQTTSSATWWRRRRAASVTATKSASLHMKTPCKCRVAICLSKAESRGSDPFSVSSLIASSGKLSIEVTAKVSAPVLFVHTPNSDGTWRRQASGTVGDFVPGRKIDVDVAGPYTLVTIGGFVADTFREGWALAFPPSRLKVNLERTGGRHAEGQSAVTIQAEDRGKGVALSAILKSMTTGCRRAARRRTYIPRWATRCAMRRVRCRRGRTTPAGNSMNRTIARRIAKKWSKAKRICAAQDDGGTVDVDGRSTFGTTGSGRFGLSGRGTGGGGMGYGGGLGKMGKSRKRWWGVAAVMQTVAGTKTRRRKKKCARATKSGVLPKLSPTRAVGPVDVVLPPQTGRVVMRVVAVQALEFSQSQRELDVKQVAGAEARLPKTFVPGAELRIPIDATNATQSTLQVSVTGPGIASEYAVPPVRRRMS